MGWIVKVAQFQGTEPEVAEVSGATVADAVVEGLTELGFDGNDEGSYYIEVSGEA